MHLILSKNPKSIAIGTKFRNGEALLSTLKKQTIAKIPKSKHIFAHARKNPNS